MSYIAPNTAKHLVKDHIFKEIVLNRLKPPPKSCNFCKYGKKMRKPVKKVSKRWKTNLFTQTSGVPLPSVLLSTRSIMCCTWTITCATWPYFWCVRRAKHLKPINNTSHGSARSIQQKSWSYIPTRAANIAATSSKLISLHMEPNTVPPSTTLPNTMALQSDSTGHILKRSVPCSMYPDYPKTCGAKC